MLGIQQSQACYTCGLMLFRKSCGDAVGYVLQVRIGLRIREASAYRGFCIKRTGLHSVPHSS